MKTRQRKVERRRAKRQIKHREHRAAVQRFQQRIAGDAHPLHACVVNRHWQEHGEATIFLARGIGEGRVTMAAFLVDIWAMGLKDAWGRTDISTGEFKESVSRLGERLGTGPLNLGTAKHLVYGGIELAGELGFRLPRRYERWTAILGPLPDGETPDMSLFLADGKVRLICSMRDLEARLIGTSPKKFLSRPDVTYIMGDDDFTLVDEEEDEFDDVMAEFGETMLDRVKQWCFANGQQPHPVLSAVIGASLEAILQGLPPDLDPDAELDAMSEAAHEEVFRQTASFLSASFHEDPAGLEAAIAQFVGFMEAVGSPEELVQARRGRNE